MNSKRRGCDIEWLRNVSTGNHTKILILLRLKFTVLIFIQINLFNLIKTQKSLHTVALHLSIKG